MLGAIMGLRRSRTSVRRRAAPLLQRRRWALLADPRPICPQCINEYYAYKSASNPSDAEDVVIFVKSGKGTRSLARLLAILIFV